MWLGTAVVAGGVDLALSIYDRYVRVTPKPDHYYHPVSYVAHVAGALAGLTVGVMVLRTIDPHRPAIHACIWWMCLGAYALFVFVTASINMFRAFS